MRLHCCEIPSMRTSTGTIQCNRHCSRPYPPLPYFSSTSLLHQQSVPLHASASRALFYLEELGAGGREGVCFIETVFTAYPSLLTSRHGVLSCLVLWNIGFKSCLIAAV